MRSDEILDAIQNEIHKASKLYGVPSLDPIGHPEKILILAHAEDVIHRIGPPILPLSVLHAADTSLRHIAALVNEWEGFMPKPVKNGDSNESRIGIQLQSFLWVSQLFLGQCCDKHPRDLMEIFDAETEAFRELIPSFWDQPVPLQTSVNTPQVKLDYFEFRFR